jgi:hypothetical protein
MITAPPTTITMAVTDGPSTRAGRQRAQYTEVCVDLKQEGVLSRYAYAGYARVRNNDDATPSIVSRQDCLARTLHPGGGG